MVDTLTPVSSVQLARFVFLARLRSDSVEQSSAWPAPARARPIRRYGVNEGILKRILGRWNGPECCTRGELRSEEL